MFGAVVLALFAHLLWASADAHLALTGVKCGGRRTCDLYQYCNKFSEACAPCSDICDQTVHNFDAPKCESECQAYIHDSRYAALGSSNQLTGDGNVGVTVGKLQHQLTVLWSLVCILIAVLVAVAAVLVWKWKKKNGVSFGTLREKCFTKKSNGGGAAQSANGTTLNDRSDRKPDLRLDIPTTGALSENSPMTVTTAVSRIPAEDCIDYAYDNLAMAGAGAAPTTLALSTRREHITT